MKPAPAAAASTGATRRQWLAAVGGTGASLAAPGGSAGFGVLGLLAACGHPGPVPADTGKALTPVQLPEADQPPAAPRELRAAWVASVAWIDWPSAPGLPVAELRRDALAMLDRAAAIGLNALILQVRPMADALYLSALEPASELLSGEQGRAVVDDEAGAPFDALAFWVAEAHRRGLELHAWINPYRARHGSARSAAAPSHVTRLHPEWVRSVGDQLWLDPGEPGAAAHTLAVVADVVSRYDIDAVHLDDYFYPYPVNGADGSAQPFDDLASWRRYQQGGGRLARDDWRRDNVDRLVRALRPAVQAIKPWVRVGISPFGIGKPALRPPGIAGLSQYDQLFADVERWCDEGWMDYLAPQLYWPRERRGQAFEVLLDYWLSRNTYRRHVWPGLFTSAVASGAQPWRADEVLAQITLLRQRPGAGGHIHFSAVALMQDRGGIATRLRDQAYGQPALVPATPWLARGDTLGATAVLSRRLDGGLALRALPAWPALPAQQAADGAAPVWRWAVWRRSAGRWAFDALPGATDTLAAAAADTLVISAVDRLGQEGPRRAFRLAA